MLLYNHNSDRAPTILQNVSVDVSILHRKLVCSHLDRYNNQKRKKIFTIKDISAIYWFYVFGLLQSLLCLGYFCQSIHYFATRLCVAYALNKENRQFSAWPIEYVKIKIHFAMLRWNQQSDRAPTILQNVSVDVSILHGKLVCSHHDLYNKQK